MVVPSHWRFAAGVCVLAAGLLMGAAGGAVAVADPDSSGSATNADDGISASDQGSPKTGSPVGNVTDTVKKTIPGVTSTLGSGQKPGQQSSIGATSPVGAVPNPGAAVPNVVASVPHVAAAVPNEVTSVPNVVKSVPHVIAAVPNVTAPVPHVIAAVPNVVAEVPQIAAAIPNVAAVPNVAAPVPNVAAPVPDVVAPVQDTLTWVAGDGVGGIGGGLSAAAGAPVAPQLPLGLPLAGSPGMPSADDTTGRATLDVIALGRASSLAEMAPPAPNGALPGAESFFRGAFGKLLLSVSLWALATAALPGLGGLVIFTAAGVRLGYRQAKAGLALRSPSWATSVGHGLPPVIAKSSRQEVSLPNAA